VLTVVLDPQFFQSFLVAHAPGALVSAIVDRDGNFIAHSLDFAERVGTQSSTFVRAAIASGVREGLYEGRTLEGEENYSAYSVSAMTGWSTHVAINYSLIARPQLLSLATAFGGGLLALALSGVLIFLSIRELSRVRSAENQMAHTQKLEALGQLTGGVAHDFNNLLAAMIGGMHMLKRRSLDERSVWIVDQVLEAATRGAALTKQLLSFSRQERLEVVTLDLTSLLWGMDALIRQSVGNSVVVKYEVTKEPLWVLGDVTQIEMALLNLAVNARDAMPNGGILQIKLPATDTPSGYVAIEVSDNGSGIPKDVLARVTEPFFTTKPQGKGTGLGLAQVYGAMTQAGGELEITSKVGLGTTARLLFRSTSPPVVHQEIAPPAPEKSKVARILVVDDEPGVRTFMAETLRAAGHEVTEAHSAAAALATLDVRVPDILVTDFAMPGGNGLELAEAAKAQLPLLKVLVVSGYADTAALKSSAIKPALLMKPFDEIALLRSVDDIR